MQFRASRSCKRLNDRYRPVGEEWEEPVGLSEEGRDAMDGVVVLDAPGSATAADGDATAVWISSGVVPCPEGGKEDRCHSYVIEASGYDPDGLPEPEVEAPAEGEVGEEIEISTPSEGLYSPEIEFGDGEKVTGTEAVHVYDQPGTYMVRATGAEELGYFGAGEHTLKIVGEGEAGGEPEPEPEGDPGSGGGAGSGTPRADSPAQPPLAGPPAGPSQACLEAQAGRDAAVAGLRKAEAKLAQAEGAKARKRLAAAKRKRQAGVRRARAHFAASC